MELFLRCKNNFVLVLTLSLILCDLIHVSETQVPQSEMKTLVRMKLQVISTFQILWFFWELT